MSDDFYYKFVTPPGTLADFVESVGTFHNRSVEAKEIVVLPDGRIDLFFLRSAGADFDVMLVGLETFPEQRIIPPQTLAFVKMGLMQVLRLRNINIAQQGSNIISGPILLIFSLSVMRLLQVLATSTSPFWEKTRLQMNLSAPEILNDWI